MFICINVKHMFVIKYFRDLVIFVKSYLEGHTLKQYALATSMDYMSSAVHWASYIRELFIEHVIGERKSNLLVMYPVNNRNADTLIPLIEKHVELGTRIFSDNWAAYFKLNEIGYPHFTVTHKTTFKQVYRNVDTGEFIQCNTNNIEGAWKISNNHFRRINGTNTKLFVQHLCEVIWRNHMHKENMYESFFSLLKSVYTLDDSEVYSYPVPVFDTWTPPSAEDEASHNYTIIQDADEQSGSDEEILSGAALEIPSVVS